MSMNGAVLTDENLIQNKEDIINAEEEKKKLKLQNKTNKNVTRKGKGPAKKRFKETQIIHKSSEYESNETFGATGIYHNCKENYLYTRRIGRSL